MLVGLRQPEAPRGLWLMRVTGGAFAAGRLPENYYDQFIRGADEGGMAAVCETEAYRDRITANPKHRDTLMALDPENFIKTLRELRELFVAGANLNVMGMKDSELNSITAPTIIIPGNDNTHAAESAGNAHRLIPGSILHKLPLEFQDVDVVHGPPVRVRERRLKMHVQVRWHMQVHQPRDKLPVWAGEKPTDAGVIFQQFNHGPVGSPRADPVMRFGSRVVVPQQEQDAGLDNQSTGIPFKVLRADSGLAGQACCADRNQPARW